MKNDYRGTTVNERLYTSSFLDKFDKAVKENDVDAVTWILKQVQLTESSIDAILEQCGLKK